MKIRLTKDVALFDEWEQEFTITYPAGTVLDVVSESADAYFIPCGKGIWKHEAEIV